MAAGILAGVLQIVPCHLSWKRRLYQSASTESPNLLYSTLTHVDGILYDPYEM